MDIKEKRKQYYINNRDKILEKSKQYYHDNKLKYEQALLNTYNDIVENGYNISML